jgi:hypothetical protein
MDRVSSAIRPIANLAKKAPATLRQRGLLPAVPEDKLPSINTPGIRYLPGCAALERDSQAKNSASGPKP